MTLISTVKAHHPGITPNNAPIAVGMPSATLQPVFAYAYNKGAFIVCEDADSNHYVVHAVYYDDGQADCDGGASWQSDEPASLSRAHTLARNLASAADEQGAHCRQVIPE